MCNAQTPKLFMQSMNNTSSQRKKLVNIVFIYLSAVGAHIIPKDEIQDTHNLKIFIEALEKKYEKKIF